MKPYMKKSAALSHIFFAFCFCFLLFACFFRYLRLNLALTLLFAFALAFLAAALLAAVLGRKREKFLFSARAEREKQSLALYLSLSSSKTAVALLSSAFPELLSPSKENLRQIGENLFVLSEKSLPGAAKESERTDHTGKTAFFSFSSEPLSVPAAETALRTLKNVFSENDEQAARAVFFCVSVKDEAAALFRKFRVQCITLDEIFEKTKTADLLPAEIADLSAVSKKKKLLSEKITKKTSKSLLVSSAILLFTSLFSPFPYYYRAIGLLLLALSLAVRLLAVRPLRASQDTGGADNKKTSER